MERISYLRSELFLIPNWLPRLHSPGEREIAPSYHIEWAEFADLQPFQGGDVRGGHFNDRKHYFSPGYKNVSPCHHNLYWCNCDQPDKIMHPDDDLLLFSQQI